MFRKTKLKFSLLFMSFGLLITLMGSNCGGSSTADCKAPKLTCDAKCITPNTDQYCGSCISCNNGKTCKEDKSKNGKFTCHGPCGDDEQSCPDANGKKVCVKLNDVKNCGACGAVCNDPTSVCAKQHDGPGKLTCLIPNGDICTGTNSNNKCEGGLCTAADPTTDDTLRCYDKTGTTCRNNNECASGDCGTNKKCLTGNTHSCTKAEDCISGICTSGTCVGVINGQACANNLSQSCTSGVCASNTCLGNYNGSCTKNMDCTSNACDSLNTCVWNVTSQCTNGQKCITGTCANQKCPTLAPAAGCFLGKPPAKDPDACGVGIACAEVANAPANSKEHATCGGKCNSTSATSCASGFYCKDDGTCAKCADDERNCPLPDGTKNCVKLNDFNNCGACANEKPAAKCTQDKEQCVKLDSSTNEYACKWNDGEACPDGATTCNSGICQNNLCVEPNNHICTKDSECASGVCGGQVEGDGKCLATNGQACGASADCISNHCKSENGALICTGVANGSPCTNDTNTSIKGDSLNKICASGACTNGKCTGNYGDTCDNNEKCTSGACGTLKTCVWDVGPGCTADEHCIMGNLCENGSCAKLGLGKACEVGTPPKANASGCEGSPSSCVPPHFGYTDASTCGGKCDQTLETSCEYGYFCNSNGDCTEEVGIGHPCLANTQCYSENCDLSSGKCDQGTLTLNTSCINNLECLSNNCQSSQCAQGTRAEDASCTDGSQCTSQKCDSGTNKCAAVLLAFGAPCTENSDCASKNCSEAFTTGLKAHKNVLSERKQICTGGGIPNDTNDLKSAGHPGDSCNNNSDCGVTGSHQMVCSVDGKCKIVSGDRHEGSTDNCIDGSSSGQGLYNLGGTSTGELICAGAAADQICTQDAGCTATTGLTCDCGSNKCALTVPGDGTALDATAGVCK